MAETHGHLLNELRKTFPNASQEALDLQVSSFSTPFSIEPQTLAAADHNEQERHLRDIEIGLRKALNGLSNLHPIMRSVFDLQYRGSLRQAKEIAPGAAQYASPYLYAMLTSTLWAVTGRHPDHSDLPKIVSASQEAKSNIGDLVQFTKQSGRNRGKPGGSRGTIDRVALVDHVISVWRKFTGLEPKLGGASFTNLLEAFIVEIKEFLPDDIEAGSAIKTYKSQIRTSLRGATRN